jgi:hypothetical protein
LRETCSRESLEFQVVHRSLYPSRALYLSLLRLLVLFGRSFDVQSGTVSKA